MAVATSSKAVKSRTVKAGNITLDEAIKLMSANITASMDEMSRRIAESSAEADRKMAESSAEADRKMAASRAETDRAIQKLTASQAETDRAIQRMSDRIEKLSAEGEKTAKEVKDLSMTVREVIGGFSRVNNRLGYVIEFIVAPGIRHEMNKMGFRFSSGKPNKIFRGIIDGKKDIVAEVDMFLSNGKEVMAAEVKTSLTLGAVKECLDKMRTLRRLEEHTKIHGKKLYGAVVGLYIDSDARAFALKNGLYVLKIEERDKLLLVEKPKSPRFW